MTFRPNMTEEQVHAEDKHRGRVSDPIEAPSIADPPMKPYKKGMDTAESFVEDVEQDPIEDEEMDVEGDDEEPGDDMEASIKGLQSYVAKAASDRGTQIVATPNFLSDSRRTSPEHFRQKVVHKMAPGGFPPNDMAAVNSGVGQIPDDAVGSSHEHPHSWETEDDMLTALGFIPNTDEEPSGHLGSMRLDLADRAEASASKALYIPDEGEDFSKKETTDDVEQAGKEGRVMAKAKLDKFVADMKDAKETAKALNSRSFYIPPPRVQHDPFAIQRSATTPTTRNHSALRGPEGVAPLVGDTFEALAEDESVRTRTAPDTYKSCAAHGISYRADRGCHPCSIMKSMVCKCGGQMVKSPGGASKCASCGR